MKVALTKNQILFLQSAIIVLVTLGALLAIVGYYTNNDILNAVGEGNVTMKGVTVFLFLLSSVTLASMHQRVWAAVIITTSIYTYTSWGINSSKPAFIPLLEDGAILSIGSGDIPSWATLVCFVFLGTAFFIYKKFFLIAVLSIGTMALIAHLLEFPPMYYYFTGYSTGMAINTAFMMNLLATHGLLPYLTQRK